MVGEACVSGAFQPLLLARTSTGPVAFMAHVVERVIAVGEQGAKHWAKRYPQARPLSTGSG